MSQEVIDRVTTPRQRIRRPGAGRHPPTRWGNAAPCEGWTARDVVAHVGNNLLRSAPACRARRPARSAPTRTSSPPGTRPRRTFLTGITTADLSTAAARPVRPDAGRADDRPPHLHRRARAHLGSRPRRRRRRAARPATRSRGAYSGLKPMDAMIRQPGVFGPKIEAAEGADVQTEFLASSAARSESPVRPPGRAIPVRRSPDSTTRMAVALRRPAPPVRWRT